MSYRPLPTVREEPTDLRHRLASATDALTRDRLHFLLLVRTGTVTTRGQAADHLARHRNTISLWAADYERGGLDALLTTKPLGKPPGQRTLPTPVFEALQVRLDEPEGFASYTEIQAWLRDTYGLDLPYSTLHTLVRYRLGAKLKAPRPRHPKKTRPTPSASLSG